MNITPELLPRRDRSDSGRSTTVEARLKLHYKLFVRRHLTQIHKKSSREGSPTSHDADDDMFEKEAATFPPVSPCSLDPPWFNVLWRTNKRTKLSHALMAISALSLANRDSSLNVEALQHYQQALGPLQISLRHEQDLASNGAFLTHFILLLYEVCYSLKALTTLLMYIDCCRRALLVKSFVAFDTHCPNETGHA